MERWTHGSTHSPTSFSILVKEKIWPDPFADSSFSVQDIRRSGCTPLYYVLKLSALKHCSCSDQATIMSPLASLLHPCFLSLLSTQEPELLLHENQMILLLDQNPPVASHFTWNKIQCLCHGWLAPSWSGLCNFLISPPVTLFFTHFTLITLPSWLSPNKQHVLESPGELTQQEIKAQEPGAWSWVMSCLCLVSFPRASQREAIHF